MHETLHVRRICPEDALVIPTLTEVDLLHAVQRLKERAPELVTAVFAIGDAVDAAFLLHSDDVADGLLFDRDQ